MIKRSINIPCIPFKKGLGEMVKLKADDAPSEAMRVREKKGASKIPSIGAKGISFAEEKENEWRFPTYDELGPHPPLEPSIFSNTHKCCESKVTVAPASGDVKKGGVLDRKEYYVDGEWVGWSKVGTSTFSRPQTRDLALTQPSTLT